jgi:hypothetical protein
MNNTQDNFSIYVRLDWADKKHDIGVQVKGESLRTFSVILHSPESIDDWIQSLHQKVKGNIAIAVKLNKGPIVYALQKYSFVTVYPNSWINTCTIPTSHVPKWFERRSVRR